MYIRERKLRVDFIMYFVRHYLINGDVLYLFEGLENNMAIEI